MKIFVPYISNILMVRKFSKTSFAWKKKMPDRPPLIDEKDFTEVFLKGSGPGGQKIQRDKELISSLLLFPKNKTSSAVQLRHLPSGIVLKVQETRSRAQNRKIAREKLALKVEMLEKGKDSRLEVIKATKSKRKASAVKKSKRKYRLLDKAKDDNRSTSDEDVC